MTFSARTREEVRQDLLDALTTRFAAAGIEIDTREKSFWFRVAESFGLVIAKLEGWMAFLEDQILPTRASTKFLDRHGETEGLLRRTSTRAELTIRVTGTPSTLITFGSQRLVGGNGIAYAASVASATTNVSGYIDVVFVAQTSGTVGNLADSSTLNWSPSPPVGAIATATVQSTATPATDEEKDALYAARIEARRQERPASGNRADWRDWVEQCDGVTEAYVYPLVHPTEGIEIEGSVTVVPIGPAQGDSTTNTRILSSGRCAEIKDFIEGTRDSTGATVTDGVQLRAVGMNVEDYQISPASADPHDINITIVNAPSHAFPWPGSIAVDASSTTTSLVVVGDYRAATIGAAASPDGKPCLLFVTSANLRGAHEVRTLGSGTFAAGKTTWAIAALPVAPSGTVYPKPPNWELIRTAVFEFFDGLGPRTITGASARWPGEEVKGRATVYKSALAAKILSTVAGVLSCTVTGADLVPPVLGSIVTLDALLVTE